MTRPTQTLRDAAILVTLVLLATTVRVTALPELPLDGPRSHAAVPAAVEPAVAVPPPTAASADETDSECRKLSRLTVRGQAPGEVVVIEVEIDPQLRAALGLCPSTDDDPRPGPAAKA